MDNQNYGGFPQNPQPNQGYQPEQQPNQGFQQAPQYQQLNQGFQQAPQYQQPNQGFQQTPQYQQPNQSFQQVPQYQTVPGGNTAVMPQPKKKKTGLIIGIILAVVVILIAAVALSGDSPEKKFYGDWTFTIDGTEELLDGDEEITAMFDEDFKYEVKVNVTFKEDNTYVMELDKESYDQASKALYDQLKKAVINSIREQLPEYADYSDEEIEKLYEDSTGEKLDADMVELIDGSGYEEAAKEFNDEGKFDVDGDKLMLSAGLEYDVDEETYYIYEIVSDNEIDCKEFYEDGILDPDEQITLIRQ